MIAITETIVAKNCYIGDTMNPFYEKTQQGMRIFLAESMTFPAHLHEQTEILYVLEGSIKVGISGHTRVMDKGECAFIFPDQVHNYLTEDYAKVLLIIFDSIAAGTYARILKRTYPDMPFLGTDVVGVEAEYAFEQLLKLQEVGDWQQNAAWIHVVLAYLLPKLTLIPDKHPEDMDLTFRLVHFIMEHFQEPLTLEQLAKELHVNKFYLSHILSQKLQMNFREYLNQIRLEYAIQSIRSGAVSLLKVWEDAGFESQRSFNRIFKAQTGMTPRDYRKSTQE